MSLLEWAKKEVEIASKRERENNPEDKWNYGVACYESALKAFESLLEDGHSGMSIAITKSILNRLIEGKPLTHIEDTEDVWNKCYRGNGDNKTTYQCKRMSSLFKDVYDDGKVVYKDINRYYCINKNDPNISWHNADLIVCDELLTDPKNGDFDTIAVLYIQRAHGERVEVNRYFKEGDTSFIEISKDEYEERAAMDKERRKQTETQ